MTDRLLGRAGGQRAELWKFQPSFDLSWGRLKPLIRPVPGNHEYRDPGAAGYFDYFNGVGSLTGQAGERGRGYYSFDVDTWHVVALNSECDAVGGCAIGSAQEQWLRQDLAAHPQDCTRLPSGTTPLHVGPEQRRGRDASHMGRAL